MPFLLAVLSILISLAGCSTKPLTNDGNPDKKTILSQLLIESRLNCPNQFHLQNQYRQDSPFTRRVNAMMTYVIDDDTNRWLIQNAQGKTGIDSYYRNHLGLRENNQRLVKTVVFSSPGLLAYTCAHGEVWVSSNFLDSDNEQSLSDDELYALLTHEYVHYRDADVLLQRVAATKRDVSRGQEYFEILVKWITNSLKLIGPLSGFKVNIDKNRALYEHNDNTAVSLYARYAWQNNEYDADARALDLMEQVGKNTSAYISLLSKIKESHNQFDESKGPFSSMNNKRMECVRIRLDNPILYYWLPDDSTENEDTADGNRETKLDLEGKFFMRHNSRLSKVFRQGLLPYGSSDGNTKRIRLSPSDIHTLCGYFHVIEELNKDSQQLDSDLSKSNEYLSWLSKSSGVTLNEILLR